MNRGMIAEAPDVPYFEPRIAITPAYLEHASRHSAIVPNMTDIAGGLSPLFWHPNTQPGGGAVADLIGRVIKPPPEGLGWFVHSGLIASLRYRMGNGAEMDGTWAALGISAADTLANAVTLWRIPRCFACGRRLVEHSVSDINFETEQQREQAKTLRRFSLKPPAILLLDCGVAIRAAGWFTDCRSREYPATAEALVKAHCILRIIAREFVWNCYRLFCSPKEDQLQIPKAVLQLFKNHALPRKYPWPNGGASGVIRDAATEILRGADDTISRGVIGIGLGVLKRGSEQLQFAVG